MSFSIKIWTKVRLKSGGPEMTATSYSRDKSGNEFYTCKWEDDQHRLHMDDFPSEALEVIS